MSLLFEKNDPHIILQHIDASKVCKFFMEQILTILIQQKNGIMQVKNDASRELKDK